MVKFYLNNLGQTSPFLSIPDDVVARFDVHPFRWLHHVMFGICEAHGTRSGKPRWLISSLSQHLVGWRVQYSVLYAFKQGLLFVCEVVATYLLLSTSSLADQKHHRSYVQPTSLKPSTRSERCSRMTNAFHMSARLSPMSLKLSFLGRRHSRRPDSEGRGELPGPVEGDLGL